MRYICFGCIRGPGFCRSMMDRVWRGCGGGAERIVFFNELQQGKIWLFAMRRIGRAGNADSFNLLRKLPNHYYKKRGACVYGREGLLRRGGKPPRRMLLYTERGHPILDTLLQCPFGQIAIPKFSVSLSYRYYPQRTAYRHPNSNY